MRTGLDSLARLTLTLSVTFTLREREWTALVYVSVASST